MQESGSFRKLSRSVATTVVAFVQRPWHIPDLRSMLLPVASLGATRVGLLALQLLASVILGRVLGPEGKGIMAILALVPSMIFTFSHLGLANSLVYHHGAGSVDMRRFSRTAVGAGLAGGVVGVLAFLALLQVGMGEAFGQVPVVWVAFAACLTPVLLVQHYLAYSFLAQEDLRGFNLLAILPMATYVGLLLVLAATGSLTVPTAFVAWVLGNAVTAALAIYRAWPSLRRPPSSDGPGWRRLFRFGLTSYSSNLLEISGNRAGTLLLNYWLVPGQVGIFTVGVSLAQMLWLLPDAVSNVLLSRSGHRQRGRTAGWAVGLSMTVAVVAAGVLWVAARWVVPFLYGASFLPAVGVLRLLLPGALAMGFVRSWAGFVIGRGRPHWLALANLAALLVVVTGSVLLIPRYGIRGAAIASTLGNLAAAFVLVAQGWRYLGQR